jgi:hypothetical protein
MAALVVGLGMSVTSCKDDDDKGDNNKIGGESTAVMGLSDDEAVLASLLQSFCDFDAEDAGSGLLNKTFVPTIGDVADASQPYVRTIVVGTQEAADNYASMVLTMLGAGNSPVGFSWKNDAIGTVSYTHGSGNELGVLSLSIKQIPTLTKLRLVKDAEGNAGDGEPYYNRGDVVRYVKDGKLYLCVSDHKYGEKSRWISFDATFDEIKKQKIGTCGWATVGADTVYSNAQASSASLADWLQYFVIDDTNYNDLIAHLKQVGIEDAYDVNQVVPYGRERSIFIVNFEQDLNPEEHVLLEAWKRQVKNYQPRGKLLYKKNIRYNPEINVYYPYELLLANRQRWSIGITFDYWVPHMVLLKDVNDDEDRSSFQKFETLLNSLPSQNDTGLNGHFKWKLEREFEVPYENTYFGKYRIYTVAVHWTHEMIEKEDQYDYHDLYGVLNFTDFNENNSCWDNRCITSHEVTHTDKGTGNSKFEQVYISGLRPN